MVLEILHNKNGAHDSLVVTIHNTAQRGKAACQGDEWVFEKTKDTMGLLCVGTANHRLADCHLDDVESRSRREKKKMKGKSGIIETRLEQPHYVVTPAGL
jgi:hypothetical protein